MGEANPQKIQQRRERVAGEVGRLAGVREWVVFVARDGCVLYVGDAMGATPEAPTVGEAFDSWLASASVEVVDERRHETSPTLASLATARQSFVRVRDPQRGDNAYRWFEWTVLGPLGDEPGVAFLVGEVTSRFLELTRVVEAERVRRRLAERVLGSQKLESLGALATRVAHDFNNLLTPIVGNAGLALLDLPSESPIRKRATAIKDAATRATALTRQLLNYAGRDLPRAEALSLSRAIEEMQLLLEAFAHSNTRLHFDLQADVPWVEVDSSHVGQVVMNLVMNASEALQPAGGAIEVSTGSVHMSEAELAGCVIGRGGASGVRAFVEVADAGPGIALADREQIFAPLFSTRAASRGLGLTAVAEVARGYGCAVDLETAPGKGTRVRVLFPLAAGAGQGEDGVWSSSADALSAAFGAGSEHGTVLLVDDDAEARASMAEVLRRQGYAVREAVSGPAAMSVFERDLESIDVVVLDYAMPLVTGADLFDAMCKLAPDVRAILVSDHLPHEVEDQLLRRGLRACLSKPFEPGDLLAAVSAALAPAGEPD